MPASSAGTLSNGAREGETQSHGGFETEIPFAPSLAVGIGAAAVAAIAFGAIGFNNGTPSRPDIPCARSRCRAVNGSLYAVSGDDVRLVPAGYQIGNGASVRTAKGSTAVLRLQDGSLVEMGERAGVSVSRAWKGTTIHLDDGQVIVQAAKQHTGRICSSPPMTRSSRSKERSSPSTTDSRDRVSP